MKFEIEIDTEKVMTEVENGIIREIRKEIKDVVKEAIFGENVGRGHDIIQEFIEKNRHELYQAVYEHAAEYAERIVNQRLADDIIKSRAYQYRLNNEVKEILRDDERTKEVIIEKSSAYLARLINAKIQKEKGNKLIEELLSDRMED